MEHLSAQLFTTAPRILLVSGSLRAGSVNGAVLRTAQAVAGEGIVATAYRGLAALPHFNPDDDRDPLPEAAAELRVQLEAADAILFSTPEYAGTLPGSFKNLLDWSVGRGIYRKPVGWVNASAHGGAAGAHETLRTVLGYTGSDIVEAACVRIPVPRNAIGDDGIIHEPGIRGAIAQAVGALAAHIASQSPL